MRLLPMRRIRYAWTAVYPRKLVLGCAFYGRGWDVADGDPNGCILLQLAKASACMPRSFQGAYLTVTGTGYALYAARTVSKVLG